MCVTRLVKWILFVFSSLTLLQNDVFAFEIPTTKEKIKIDANLSDSAWSKAYKVDISNVTWPDENVSAPVLTQAFVIEDGDTLYVAFKAYDPNPEQIRAFLTDRDKNWEDDRVGIKIDTYNDGALAYQFFVNPLGTQADAIDNELTKTESDAWNAIWDSAGKITDFGYVVEMAIPFRVFNFNDDLAIQNWKLELLRYYPRDQELRISNAHIDHNNDCWICQMTPVTGLKQAKQGNNFLAIPTFVSGVSQSRNPVISSDWSEQRNSDIGLDLEWGISPDITLNTTINPDFSQVEADRGQLNVNSNFALFTPERRTFFLSNIDYFNTPVSLIYTRNINDPDYGAKITGKQGPHSFGAFVANDTSTSLLLPGNLSSDLFEVQESSVNGAFRYRYAFNDKLALGSTMTARSSDSYHNYLYSFDSKYKATAQDTFDLQVMSSNTGIEDDLLEQIKQEVNNEQKLRLDSANTSDLAYRLSYRHKRKDWYFDASRTQTGENFRADLAFYENVDQTTNAIGSGYTWQGDHTTWYDRFELEGKWSKTSNQDGAQIEQESRSFFTVWGPKQALIRHGIVLRDRVAGRINTNALTIDGNAYEFQEKEFHSWSHFKPSSNFWTGVFIRLGENIDYANLQLANSLRIEPHFNWNINRHLYTRFTHRYRKLIDKNDDELFTARLIDIRLTYQFSARSFVRFSAIYSDVQRNLNNYNEDIRSDYNSNYKSLATQLLYSYKLNPQTLFFVGYSDGAYQDDELDKLTKDTRSVFLKLSYAWLL